MSRSGRSARTLLYRQTDDAKLLAIRLGLPLARRIHVFRLNVEEAD
jgi:hypothetical protein